MVQAISRRVGYWATNIGSLCARFVDLVPPVKNQVENRISKLFDLRGHTIDVSVQYNLTLKDSGLNAEEVKKNNISNPLTAGQRKSGHVLLLMMAVHPNQSDPNCKHSHIPCRSCIKLPLDIDGIDSSTNTQMLKPPHILLVHLVVTKNERNLDIITLN